MFVINHVQTWILYVNNNKHACPHESTMNQFITFYEQHKTWHFFLFRTLHLVSIKSIWLNRLCKRTIMNKQLVLMHNIFDIIESKAQGLTFFIVSDIVGNQYSKRNYVNWRKNWWTEGKLTKCLEFMSLLCVEMYKMQVQMGTK